MVRTSTIFAKLLLFLKGLFKTNKLFFFIILFFTWPTLPSDKKLNDKLPSWFIVAFFLSSSSNRKSKFFKVIVPKFTKPNFRGKNFCPCLYAIPSSCDLRLSPSSDNLSEPSSSRCYRHRREQSKTNNRGLLPHILGQFERRIVTNFCIAWQTAVWHDFFFTFCLVSKMVLFCNWLVLVLICRNQN